MELDKILELLNQAKVIAQSEPKSRELSLTITKIEEAILWRELDMKIKEITKA